MVMAGPVAVAQSAPAAPQLDLSRADRFVAGLQVRSFERPPPWIDANAVRLPRYPFMADPRRWPPLFANTTEGTLSLNPITRRHWWQG